MLAVRSVADSGSGAVPVRPWEKSGMCPDSSISFLQRDKKKKAAERWKNKTMKNWKMRVCALALVAAMAVIPCIGAAAAEPKRQSAPPGGNGNWETVHGTGGRIKGRGTG